MKAAIALTAITALTSAVLAAPTKLARRQVINANGTDAGGVSDIDILQFALTLEYLELHLYQTVVSSYDDSAFSQAGFSSDARNLFLQIVSQEEAHIAGLKSGIQSLGGTPTQPCEYNFGNFSSLNDLVNVTDAVNGLGPSAYLGANSFVQSKLLRTEGGSIGISETRHNSWLNDLLGRNPLVTPFQLPLSPTQSWSIASQFIVNGSCPESNPKLKAVTAEFPPLAITNPGYPASPLQPGETVTFALPKGGNITAPRVAFLYAFNTTIVDLDSSANSAVIPDDAGGQTYAVLTTAVQGEALDDKNSLSAIAPFFVDIPASNFANMNVTA